MASWKFSWGGGGVKGSGKGIIKTCEFKVTASGKTVIFQSTHSYLLYSQFTLMGTVINNLSWRISDKRRKYKESSSRYEACYNRASGGVVVQKASLGRGVVVQKIWVEGLDKISYHPSGVCGFFLEIFSIADIFYLKKRQT